MFGPCFNAIFSPLRIRETTINERKLFVNTSVTSTYPVACIPTQFVISIKPVEIIVGRVGVDAADQMCNLPVAASHTRIVLSSNADAIFDPSGLKQTDVTPRE